MPLSIGNIKKFKKNTENLKNNGYSERPSFKSFVIVDERGFKIPGTAYLKSDFNGASAKFREVFNLYQKIAEEEDTLWEGYKSPKLLAAERKLLKLEKKEGIKRYTREEQEHYLSKCKDPFEK